MSGLPEPMFIPIWVFYLIIISFTVGIVGFSLWYFWLRWRNRFMVHVMQDWKVIKTLRLKCTVKTFKFGSGRYKIDPKGAIKNRRNVPVLYYDIDHAEPVVLEKLSSLRNPKDLDSFMKSEALGKLLSRTQTKMLFALMIIGMVGIGVTAIVGFYFIKDSNDNLQRLFRQYMNATTGGKIK